MGGHIEDRDQDHSSVYDGLLDHEGGGDDSQWAFGTDFEDPLAGVDTAIPDGVDPQALAAYCLMLGDDALIHAHRLAQWSSRAPDLEDDIALSNIALDLLGQARLLLARAAAADPGLVPELPEGSPVPAEDALAFFRDERDFRNVRLVEAENGDFAVTIARLLLAAPRVVILDEATAHLDSESEAAVQEALAEALVGRTAIVIAHRLSTVRAADAIAVVEAGRVVEQGTHDELLARGGRYADLHHTQFRSDAGGASAPSGVAVSVTRTPDLSANRVSDRSR